MGFRLGGSCSPCCVGCPESLTVTLSDLPHKLTGGDNYVTSNEGSFHLKKIFDDAQGSRGDKVCRWEYKDVASAGIRADYVILRITLEHWTIQGRFGTSEELRLYVEMDTGEIHWRKGSVSLSPQSYTFTNTDLTFNSWDPGHPAGMRAVSSAYDPASRDQCDGYLPCKNWRDAATAEETCPPIMTVTDAMDSANYCGKPPAVFKQAVPGTAPPLYVEFVQGGTDSLDLTLSSKWEATYISSIGGIPYATSTIDWGGGTYSLGWGGYDNVKAYVTSDTEPSTTCGGWNAWHFYSEGWVSVIPGVTLTYDSSVSGGSINKYNCIAIAQANLVKGWTPYPGYSAPIQYPARRILLKIALLCKHPSAHATIIGARNDHSFAFASDGTLGEDAYAVGSFPTFTESNASTMTRICPISLNGRTYNYTFRLEQG